MNNLIVSEKTFTQLNKIALEKGNTVEALAEEVIKQFLQQEARKKMQQETKAFYHLHPTLLPKYANQYVAIHHSQVIDHDQDQIALFSRIDKKYPDTAILIKQVQAKAEEIYTIRSPRLQYE